MFDIVDGIFRDGTINDKTIVKSGEAVEKVKKEPLYTEYITST